MNKNKIYEWLIAFGQACVIVVILFILCWPVNIEGPSMENTFYTGDKVAICRLLVILHKIDTGDLVVCTIQNRGAKEYIIKRVIAVSGDHIVIKNGKVMVNDNILNESYARGLTYGDVDEVVPQDCVYLLGDNRENSMDSREIGVIPYSKLNGRVLFRFFPFNQIKTFFSFK